MQYAVPYQRVQQFAIYIKKSAKREVSLTFRFMSFVKVLIVPSKTKGSSYAKLCDTNSQCFCRTTKKSLSVTIFHIMLICIALREKLSYWSRQKYLQE